MPSQVFQSVVFNLLRRFQQYADAVLRFVSDPTVPLINKVAEHGAQTKVKQKIAGCFRTPVGAENFRVTALAWTCFANRVMTCWMYCAASHR